MLRGIDKWRTDLEVKACIGKRNVNSRATIVFVAEYEGEAGILRQQLIMKGIIHQVSTDGAVVFEAKSILESLTTIPGQPDMGDRGIDEGENASREQLFVCYFVVAESNRL